MKLEEFKNPEALYRNAPFFSWNDKLDKDELKRQIKDMAEKGWGSYFMHSRVGLVTGYLSEEWMDMIKACAETARETGTYAWLYDEDKWPSGFAGGIVPNTNEKFRSSALVLIKSNEITKNDIIMSEIDWEGQRYIICKRISPLGNLWFNGSSYVDLMNPEAVKTFIKVTHEKYKETVGKYFGKEIPGIFTDEPCYLMEIYYNVPAIPWSIYLPDFFKKLKGYNIEEHVKELFFDIGDYKKIRFDFYDAATRLFLESWTKQYYDWCEKNNLKMTGHFMGEDDLVSQTQWIGAAMPHYEFMHWPGIDKLGRNINQLVTVNQVSSVADQLNKERVLCEVFGTIGQQVSFYHRKWIADWEAALGISFVNSHLSLYSMRGERKRDYPANLYYQQPWWDDERKFADYIGRISYAVSQGKREVDILVLHPIASVWSEYSPLHKQNGFPVENSIYNRHFEVLSTMLREWKLDYHYGDEIIMESHAKVQDGKLIIGQHKYSTVIVPPSLTLRTNTVKLLREFAEQAGADRLIFIKPVPSRVDGILGDMNLPDGVLYVNSVKDALDIVDKYYDYRIKITDKMTGENADKIYCHSRIAKEGRSIFLVNTDEQREINAIISLPYEEEPYILDLMSGEIFAIPSIVKDGRREISVKFYPAGSMLLYYTDENVNVQKVPNYLDSGLAFTDDDVTLKDLVITVDNWEVNFLEQNVLPLNDVTLYLDGKKVLENEPVAYAWNQHFYKVDDGTPFKAEYTFEVINIPEGEIFAVIEVAENLDRITINDIEIRPLKQRGELGAFDPNKSWKDINFTKVPLTGKICEGVNKLTIEGKKVNNITGPGTHISVKDFKNHFPTEVEAVYIVGNFIVMDFNKKHFTIDGKFKKPNYKDLTESGYPFYAGKVEFVSQIEYKKENAKAYLIINDVKAACIELYVNDKYVDVKYWEPYVFDVTNVLKEGKNEIKIVAATTLFNLMGPNRIARIFDDEFVGPNTFVDFNRFTEKYALLPLGIGSASLLCI